MGGKRELELETRKCLLYCLHVKLTTQKTFFPTAETLVFPCIYYYYYYRQSHFLSHYESLNVSYIAVFIVKKMETFHIYCFFSPQLSAIAFTPFYSFHFSSPACSSNH